MQIKKLLAVIAVTFVIALNFTACKDKGNTSSEASSTVSSRPSVSSEEAPVSSDSSEVSSAASSVVSKPRHNNVSSEPHLHAYLKTKVEPTCTADGYTLYKCSCGKWYTDSLVPKLGHKWGDWKVTVAPTATAEGKEERECTVCGETEARPIEKLQAATPEELEKDLLLLLNDARTKNGAEKLELSEDENAAKLAEYLITGKTEEYEAELARLNAAHTGSCQISGYDTAQKAFEALQSDENHSKEILKGEYKHISLIAVIDGENVRWALVLWS